jgi:arginine-tRNA-protein transferase
MERGWRRCGTYYYKTDLTRSCCKQWTLRQDATKFRIKKDQKKTVRKIFDLIFGVQESKKASNPKSKEKPAQNEKMAIEVN